MSRLKAIEETPSINLKPAQMSPVVNLKVNEFMNLRHTMDVFNQTEVKEDEITDPNSKVEKNTKVLTKEREPVVDSVRSKIKDKML